MGVRRRPREGAAAQSAPKRRGRPPGKSPLSALKLAAKSAYTLSIDPISVDDLAEQPDFVSVGRARMRQWAAEGDWHEERRTACQAWRQRAEGSLGAMFLRRQARQMQLLAHLHDEAVRLRCQQSVQPRSWESVANVQLKAADLMRQWSRDHAQAIAQLGTPATNISAGKGKDQGAGLGYTDVEDLSDEEAQIGAHAILRSKLARRQRSDSTDEDPGQLTKSENPPVPLRRALGSH